MAKTIAEIKKEYPVYQNIPDVELADKIYDKYYKGKLDPESYYQQVFPDIQKKPSLEKFTQDPSFQETLEYLPAGKELTVGMVGTGLEESFKPTTEEIAMSAGVSVNDPATSKARFGASLGYDQNQKQLALKNTLSELYEQDIDVRRGSRTGELEYYNPDIQSYSLVDEPGMDLGDFADMGGDAMVIIPDILATIGVGVMTSGTAAVPSGAAAAFGGEFGRLKLGQTLYGINKDLTNDQIIKKAAAKAGISLAAGYAGLGIAKFIKGTDNLLKGRLDMTDDLAKILDDKSKVNADLIAKQINEKLDQAKMGSKLKYTLAEALNDADMLATQSQFENVRRLGYMDRFRTAGIKQAEALNDYFKILKSGFNTGAGGKPINQFEAGELIQKVIRRRNEPAMQNLINKQSQAEELVTKATGRLPDGSLRTTGVEFRSVVDDLAKTYKRNVDVAAKKLDEAAGVPFIKTDIIAEAIAKLSAKEKASFLNAAKLENLFKPGVFEQLSKGKSVSLIGDVRETASGLSKMIRDKEIGSVTGETVDVGKLKFLNKAFKEQINRDVGSEYLAELEKFSNLVISGKQLLNNETIAKLTSISPQKQLMVANEDVFATTFKKGIGSGQKAQAVFDVIKETPDAMKAYKDSIYEFYKSKVFKDGIPNLIKHKQFMKDYEPALKVFFSEIDFTKLNRIGGLKKQLDDITKLRKETSDKLLKSFEGKLENLSPDELIRKIYRPNSLKDIRELKNILKNDPDVWKSFQRNVLTDLNERVKTGSTRLGIKIVNPQAFDTYINGVGGEVGKRGYRLALGEVFNKEFMDNLELLNKGLQVSGRRPPNAASEGMVGSAFSDIIRARLGQFTLMGRLFTAARRIYKRGSEMVIANALLNPASLKDLAALRVLKPTSERAAEILGKLGGYIFVRD
jgi:hypothetical protein